MGSTKIKPSFLFDDNEIVTLYDPPHLLKSTRNIFLKYDCKFQVEAENEYYEAEASWKHITDVYKRDKIAAPYHMLPKLTDAHLNPTFHQKMNVSMAAQVLSHTVSAAIMKDIRCGKCNSI